jgi:hypothetical protein
VEFLCLKIRRRVKVNVAAGIRSVTGFDLSPRLAATLEQAFTAYVALEGFDGCGLGYRHSAIAPLGFVDIPNCKA